MDGIIYSTVSNNLANGYGTPLFPMYTETYVPIFNGHPPVVIWMEAIFFKLFGSGFWVERLYMFVILLFNLLGIYKILQLVHHQKKMIYSAVLFIFTPLTLWCFQNNMLECTMMMFSMWSVYIGLLIAHRRVPYLPGSLVMALLLLLSFGSKGFPGLFPLGTYVFYAITNKQYSLKRALGHTLTLLGCLGLLVGILSLNEEIVASVKGYLETQVFSSIKGELGTTNSTRFRILVDLVSEFGIPVGVLVIAFFVKRKKGLSLFSNKADQQLAVFLILLGLSASVPLMVSPKLRAFYVFPALPYFVIAATLCLPELNLKEQTHKLTRYFGIGLSVLAIGLTIALWNNPKRDTQLLEDIHNIAEVTTEKTIIGCDPSLNSHYSVRAYFMRYHFISLTDTPKNPKNGENIEYYIQPSKNPMQGYHLVDLGSKELFLFQKN